MSAEPETALLATASWRSGALVGLGAVLPVTASIGPMAGALGTGMVAVWACAAAIGALQCVLLAELALRYPRQAGGTATYAHRALAHWPASLRALSGWGYWLAWTPGIAVNLVLAAGYLRVGLHLPIAQLPLAAVMAAGLYAVNALGLRPALRVAALLAPLAALPLLGLAFAPHAPAAARLALAPHVLTAAAPLALAPHALAPSAPAGARHALAARPQLAPPSRRAPGPGDGSGLGHALAFVKWLFVAAWAAYGAEMATTVVSELRDPRAAVPKALAAAALSGLIAFALVPTVLVHAAGAGALAGDPYGALLAPARAVYGPAGGTLLALSLAAALLVGAQAFALGSSRTIFQMARDGLLPRALAASNGRGVPVGSIALDGAVIALLLTVFGTNVVDVVAAANVGYLAVFVLMPAAFLAARRRHGRLLCGRAWDAIAWTLLLTNAALLVLGGALWGTEVVLLGAALLALAVPLARYAGWSAQGTSTESSVGESRATTYSAG